MLQSLSLLPKERMCLLVCECFWEDADFFSKAILCARMMKNQPTTFTNVTVYLPMTCLMYLTDVCSLCIDLSVLTPFCLFCMCTHRAGVCMHELTTESIGSVR